MNEQQAQQLAERIEREEPRFRAIHDLESQAPGPGYWVVRLFLRATGEPRDVIASESEWDQLNQYLLARGF